MQQRRIIHELTAAHRVVACVGMAPVARAQEGASAVSRGADLAVSR